MHGLEDAGEEAGEAAGVSVLADAVRDSATTVVAMVGALCCSAAYWVASQSDFIVAGSTTLIGSIGTKSRAMRLDKLFKKMGAEIIEQRSEQSPD